MVEGRSHSSWGGAHSHPVKTFRPRDPADVKLNGETYLPCGAGRSYGDSCLPGGASAISTLAMNRVLSFDAANGFLRAEAGATLRQLLDAITPHGWFLPVTPGTGHVTLGGAIANDVHGKNHHVAGTFGCYLRSFELLRSDGSRLLCSQQENSDLFRATIGGMGLTGLIVSAEIALMRTASPFIVQTATRFANIDAFFEAEQRKTSQTYSVAWIDGMAEGAKLGRGVLLEGEHAPAQTHAKTTGVKLGVPFTPPLNLVLGPGVRLMNAAYMRQREGERLVHYAPFFYPLDALAHWNRLYGPRGFHQFQCVVPLEASPHLIRQMLETAVAAGGSPLAVLKRFGEIASPGLISFPRAGYTLTMDFANKGDRTDRLMGKLDTLALESGGRVNPYKSRRMSRETFTASFPHWRSLLPHLDPAACSAFSMRVGLTIAAAHADACA